MRELVVYLDGVRTGVFTQDAAGSISFRYDDDLPVTATPLSLSMPLVPGQRYRNRVARPFLQGLLSDDRTTLRALGARYGVSAGNPMALLEHVGRDTAGAVQLLPPGVDSDDAAERTGAIDYVDDLDGLVAEIVADAEDWVRTRDEMHWSLAGAQPKIALYRAPDGRWGVPRDSTPTTHILKPAATGSRHDLNEFVTMRAARILGLVVADHDVLTTDRGHHVFVSRRYDRVEIGGRLRRLHQEDFAQALGVDPANKYQADGGPGVGDMARVFAAFPPAAQDAARRACFDALVYTVASLNTDAHAKNYSIVHLGPQMRLAPLYDLGSNALYRGDQPLASAVTIGGERLMSRIGVRELLAAARILRVDADYAESSVQRIRRGVADAFLAARDETVTDDAAYVARLVDAVAERARERGWDAD